MPRVEAQAFVVRRGKPKGVNRYARGRRRALNLVQHPVASKHVEPRADPGDVFVIPGRTKAYLPCDPPLPQVVDEDCTFFVLHAGHLAVGQGSDPGDFLELRRQRQLHVGLCQGVRPQRAGLCDGRCRASAGRPLYPNPVPAGDHGGRAERVCGQQRQHADAPGSSARLTAASIEGGPSEDHLQRRSALLPLGRPVARSHPAEIRRTRDRVAVHLAGVTDGERLSLRVDGDGVGDVRTLDRSCQRHFTHPADMRSRELLAVLLVRGGRHHGALRRLDRHLPTAGDVDLLVFRGVLGQHRDRRQHHGRYERCEPVHENSSLHLAC